MPRRTIVKVYPAYDDKPTFVESSPVRMTSPERDSTGKTLTPIEHFNVSLYFDWSGQKRKQRLRCRTHLIRNLGFPVDLIDTLSRRMETIGKHASRKSGAMMEKCAMVGEKKWITYSSS
jgi:hypothetical protein